jgi:GNAT superfamily N-acetyltransferase
VVVNSFGILGGHKQVATYLMPLCEAADEHRNALGFFAKSVYEEFARGDGLYVLVNRASDKELYAGHLLLSSKYPRASILQIFVLPEHRRHGGASRLVDHVKEILTYQGYISIYARVAEDLIEANRFWERQQFYVQRVERGGSARNRKILVRIHELPSPQLFPTSGINSTNPLGLSVGVSSEPPLFLLDLNVLFDVMPRRLRRDEVVGLL